MPTMITLTCEWVECRRAFTVEIKRYNYGQRFCCRRCACYHHNATDPHFDHLPAAGRAWGDKVRGTGKKCKYVKRGGRHEHRVVMEQLLGRPLGPDEIVHHDDEDGRNNDPDNLELTSRPEHIEMHRDVARKPPKERCLRGHIRPPERRGKTCRECWPIYAENRRRRNGHANS